MAYSCVPIGQKMSISEIWEILTCRDYEKISCSTGSMHTELLDIHSISIILVGLKVMAVALR